MRNGRTRGLSVADAFLLGCVVFFKDVVHVDFVRSSGFMSHRFDVEEKETVFTEIATVEIANGVN